MGIIVSIKGIFGGMDRSTKKLETKKFAYTILVERLDEENKRNSERYKKTKKGANMTAETETYTI